MNKILPMKRLLIAGFILFLAFGISLYIKGQTIAGDPPHDASNADVKLRVYCTSCHSLHKAKGTALTNNASNANLCLSCHSATGIASTKRLDTTMLAVPGTSGTSHRWDKTMPATSKASNQYGLRASADLTNKDLKIRLTTFGNVVTCSVCHNQHSQARTPWYPDAPASGKGRRFQRITNDLNQMCEDCHAYRAMSYTGARGDDGSADGTKKFSHPVGEVLNSQGYDKTAPLDYDGGAQQTAPRYHANSADDTNTTNNVVFDSSTKVRCLSCHGIHYKDSNGMTVDGPIKGGDYFYV